MAGQPGVWTLEIDGTPADVQAAIVDELQYQPQVSQGEQLGATMTGDQVTLKRAQVALAKRGYTAWLAQLPVLY